MSKVRCALKDAGMPELWWPEALMYMTYVQNRTPMSRLQNKKPYEKVYGKTPDVSDLQILGSTSFAHVPTERRKDKKLSAQATKRRFLGVSEEYKAYRLLDVYNNKFIYSSHVMFDTQHIVEIVSSAFEQEMTEETETSHSNSAVEIQYHICYQAHLDKISQEETNHNKIPIPRNLKETLSGPYRKHWRNALDLEYESLIDNGTWRLVPPPPGRKALPCHWVLVVKYHANGFVERFKARLVAQGNHQEFGVDCDEVYGPVARFESLRLVLAIGTILDCHIHQMDVHTAFLNGTTKGLRRYPLHPKYGSPQKQRDKTMSISQHQYILDLLKKYNIEKSSAVTTPQLAGRELEPETNMSAAEIAAQNFDYRG
ncbi:unnamed protein product [Phytophthora fragariaefolia]|uniref:Unnamed protein product n=1 Tax=Phytophthora fragariaefolia TaxID=1490495 RepID=A0A9W6XUA9_9STRA|nr:unnamed protein product [Phytophthora fragariaefolia]